MSKSLPFMKWYPRDFAASTRGWPLIAKAIYRELLDYQWEVGSIPESAQECSRIVQAHAKQWSMWITYFDEKFPTIRPGERQNKRLDEIRQEALNTYEKRIEAAKKGGQAKHKKGLPHAMPNGRPNGNPNGRQPEPDITGSSSSYLTTSTGRRRPSEGRLAGQVDTQDHNDATQFVPESQLDPDAKARRDQAVSSVRAKLGLPAERNPQTLEELKTQSFRQAGSEDDRSTQDALRTLDETDDIPF